MLPQTLLSAALKEQCLIELKSGDTLNGTLDNCDMYMNVILKNAIQTSADGESFLKIDEVYIRGTTIKYLRIPEEVMTKAKAPFKRQNKSGNRFKNENK